MVELNTNILEPARQETLHDIKVLVLDDEEGIRNFVGNALRKSGCLVETASNGRQGLQLLLQKDFDVLVVDVRMDEMDGITFLQEARKIWPWLGVVVMTGYTDKTSEHYAHQMGINRMLQKPIELPVLLETVFAEALGKRQRVDMPASLSLDRVQHQLSILRQLSESAIASESLIDALRGLSDGLGNLLPCSVVGVLALEENEQVLLLRVKEEIGHGFINHLKEELYHQYEALTGENLPKESLRIEVEGVTSREDGSEKAESTFTVPIITSGELYGLLILGSTTNNAYTTEDISFLYHAANHLSAIFVALSRMRKLAIHDGLTSLYNRKRLEEELEMAWDMSRRYDHVMSVAIIDIDKFKSINDTHGHLVGDEVLRELSNVVNRVARSSDIIGRYGGDEIVVVLPRGGMVAARAFSERLLSSVRNHTFSAEYQDLNLTVSVGIANSQNKGDPQSGHEVLDQADQALYLAKRSGRNRVCVWSDHIAQASNLPGETPAIGTPEIPSPSTSLKSKGRVMVVDDEPSVGKLITLILEPENYEVNVQQTANAAVTILRKEQGLYDVVLTDLHLPGKSGFELLEDLKEADDSITKIVITGHATVDNAIASLRHGAYDFIEKPFAHEQLIAVINRAIELKHLRTENTRYQLYLEEMVQKKSAALTEALEQVTYSYNFTLEALVAMLDAREHATGQHSLRVRDLALEMARHMDLSQDEIEIIGRGALLHDIGKIAIPDAILLKPGPLLDDEREVIKKHAEIGFNILRSSSYLEKVAEIVLSHQERYDGTGYPRGLKDEEICLGARIFAIVDAYDAMRSDRPYRSALKRKDVIEEIVKNRGFQFDPDIVDVFIRCQDDLERIGEWQRAETRSA